MCAQPKHELVVAAPAARSGPNNLDETSFTRQESENSTRNMMVGSSSIMRSASKHAFAPGTDNGPDT